MNNMFEDAVKRKMDKIVNDFSEKYLEGKFKEWIISRLIYVKNKTLLKDLMQIVGNDQMLVTDTIDNQSLPLLELSYFTNAEIERGEAEDWKIYWFVSTTSNEIVALESNNLDFSEVTTQLQSLAKSRKAAGVTSDTQSNKTANQSDMFSFENIHGALTLLQNLYGDETVIEKCRVLCKLDAYHREDFNLWKNADRLELISIELSLDKLKVKMREPVLNKLSIIKVTAEKFNLPLEQLTEQCGIEEEIIKRMRILKKK